jgi:SBF-like CPA transporter family (DUF4137)
MKPPSSEQRTAGWPASGARPTKAAAGLKSWIQTNGFILGLFAVVGHAFLFPDPGSRNGWMHPELVQNVGIALILFLQGLSMPLEKVQKGAGNWQLHVILQSFTFLNSQLSAYFLLLLPRKSGQQSHRASKTGFYSFAYCLQRCPLR